MEKNKELIVLNEETSTVKKGIFSLIIKDEETLKRANDIRQDIKMVEKRVKEHKDARIKPLKSSIELLQADYAPIEAQLKEAKELVGDKIIAYDTQLRAEIAAKEQKLADRVDRGTLKMETAAVKISELPKVQNKIVSEKGSAVLKNRKNFRVVDISKLPLAYLKANEPAIRQAMYDGVEVQGCEYFLERTF